MNKTDKFNVSIDSQSQSDNSTSTKPLKQSSELLKMIADVRASKKRVKKSSTSITSDKLMAIMSMRCDNQNKKEEAGQYKMKSGDQKKLTLDPRLGQKQTNKQLNHGQLFGHRKFPQINGSIPHKYPQLMLCRQSKIMVEHSRLAHDHAKKIKSLSIRSHLQTEKIHSSLIKKCQSLQFRNKHYLNGKKKVLTEKVNQIEKKNSLKKMIAVSSYLKIQSKQNDQTKQTNVSNKYHRKNEAFDYMSRLKKAENDIYGNQRQLYVPHFIQQHSMRSLNSKCSHEVKHVNGDSKLIEELADKAMTQVKKNQFFGHPPEQERIVYLKLRQKIKSDFYHKKMQDKNVDRLNNLQRSFSVKQKQKINKKQIQFNIKSTFQYLRNQVPKNMLHMRSFKGNLILDKPTKKLIIK